MRIIEEDHLNPIFYDFLEESVQLYGDDHFSYMYDDTSYEQSFIKDQNNGIEQDQYNKEQTNSILEKDLFEQLIDEKIPNSENLNDYSTTSLMQEQYPQAEKTERKQQISKTQKQRPKEKKSIKINSAIFQSESNEQIDQNVLSFEQKKKKELIHLRGQRRKKGFRNKLQESDEGYWTKNLLPFAKNPHFDIIQEIMGYSFLLQEENAWLLEIKNRKCITMKDYETLYKYQSLNEVWRKFFAEKVIYRKLMVSKVRGSKKKTYVKFFCNFEKAWKSGRFVVLSRTIKE